MPVAATKPVIVIQKTTGIFRSPRQRKLVLGLLLVVATLALYNPAARCTFLGFDDDRYVTDNPHVRAGLHWSTVSWAFASLEQANWHPLTWLSHALDCQLFQLNAAGHHYTNILFHAANALLLFLILQRFTGYTARSLMVAALFAVHPLNVESVAWVSERKNVLCMFFCLLTIAAYGWYVRRPGIQRYTLVALLFAGALMAKPMAITLPFVLLLLDYWPLNRLQGTTVFSRSPDTRSVAKDDAIESRVPIASGSYPAWKLCLEKLPLLVLSAGSAVVTMLAQRSGGAVLTSAARNPSLRFENVIVSYALYLKKALWPSHLAILYPYPHKLPLGQVVISAIVLFAITGLVLKYRQRSPYLAVGWLWYLGTMVPMIGLIQVGNQAMADRYAYLPLIGFFIMIVWSIADWASPSRNSISRQPTNLLYAAALSILLALSVLTHIQIRYWHDDFALWSHALAVTQNNFVAENNFANALITAGRPDEAIQHFRAAAAIEPLDSASQLNLGIYAQEHGDFQQAIARYENALQLATDTQIRGSAYANLGTVYFALHDDARAQQNFDAAMKLNRVYPSALLDLGLIAERTARKRTDSTKHNNGTKTSKDDWNRAAGYFTQFVALAPSDVGYLLLADAFHHAGRDSEAVLAEQRAVLLSKDIGQARQRAAQLTAP